MFAGFRTHLVAVSAGTTAAQPRSLARQLVEPPVAVLTSRYAGSLSCHRAEPISWSSQGWPLSDVTPADGPVRHQYAAILPAHLRHDPVPGAAGGTARDPAGGGQRRADPPPPAEDRGAGPDVRAARSPRDVLGVSRSGPVPPRVGTPGRHLTPRRARPSPPAEGNVPPEHTCRALPRQLRTRIWQSTPSARRPPNLPDALYPRSQTPRHLMGPHRGAL